MKIIIFQRDVIDNFDELAYVAIHTDLMNALDQMLVILKSMVCSTTLILELRKIGVQGRCFAYINENGLNDLFFEDPDLVK